MRFPISISLMSGNSETKVVTVSSLEELSRQICENDWAPAIFEDNRRLAANFISCDVIGLDIDSGLSLEEAKMSFAHYAHLIIPTKSHQKMKNGVTADRYRVLLFPDRKIANQEQFSATWMTLYKKFPFIDKSAKDCSRMFYRCPHEVASLKADGSYVVVCEEKLEQTKVARPAPSATYGKLTYSTLQFMNEGAPNGTWNDSLYKAARDYQQNGRTIEDFIVDAKQITGKLDTNDLSTVESAFKNEPRYEPRTDFDDGLRRIILSSSLIVNQEDSGHTFLVDPKNGKTVKIDVRNIKSALKGDFEYYIKSKRVIASICYEPHQHEILWPDERGLYFYNSYRPPEWKNRLFFAGSLDSVSTPPEIYEKFFMYLTANDLPSYNYLVDWLALALQRRNLTILTAIGEEGIGKGILGEIMEDLHGASNFVKVRDNVFKEKFNAPFENRTLVYVDEIKITSREALDRIKDVVNWQIEIEKKGEDPKSITNHASFYLSSNSFDAIPIEHGQRRFSIIQLTDIKLKDSAFGSSWPSMQELVDELRLPKNIQMLASFLYNKKVDSKKMLEPFVSERARDVKEAGMKEWESWVIQDWCPTRSGRGVVNCPIEELQSAIKAQFPKLDRLGRRAIEELGKKFPEVFYVKKIETSGKVARTIEIKTQFVTKGAAISTVDNPILDEADKLV